MHADWMKRCEINAQALADPKVKEQTDGKTIRKIIFIPEKIFNIVVG